MEETPQDSNKQGEVNPRVNPRVMAEQSGPIRRCEMRQMEYRICQKRHLELLQFTDNNRI